MILFLQCLGLLYVIIGIFMALATAIELQTGLYKSTASRADFVVVILNSLFCWPLIVCLAIIRSL